MVRILADLLSLRDLQGLFWDVLTRIVDNPDVQIRRSWPQNGSPDWKISDNVIFVQVHEEGGADISQPVDTVYEDDGTDLKETRYSTRVIRLNLVAYGPAAYINLQKIRLQLYGYDRVLHQSKIYAIPEPDRIKSVPELFQGRWWERADLDVCFNTVVAIDRKVGTYRYFAVITDYEKEGRNYSAIEKIVAEK